MVSQSQKIIHEFTFIPANRLRMNTNSRRRVPVRVLAEKKQHLTNLEKAILGGKGSTQSMLVGFLTTFRYYGAED
jgi:hypothetical protein